MKILLCLFLVTGINHVSCFSSQLSRDLKDIAALIPNQELFQIFNQNNFDPASHEASKYVASIDFYSGIYLISKHPNIKPIKQYLELNNINLKDIFLKIIIEKEKNGRKSNEPIERRAVMKLKNFVERAYSVSQMDNIVSLVIHKTATSTAFRELYGLINTLNYNKVYTDVMTIPKVKDMVLSLNKVGINTNEVWRAMSYLFGWDKVTNIISLEEYEIEEDNREAKESPLLNVLRQFLNLISKEKFIFLYRGLLVNPLFQEITAYIYNKQYYKIIEIFDKNLIIGQFFDYLKTEGVSIYKLLDLMRDRLGFTYAYFKIPTGKYEENSHTFSLYQFFDMAKQILPINEIRKLKTDLLRSSNEYRTLTGKIIDIIYNNNVDLFFTNHGEIQNKAMQYGFNVNKVINFIFLIIGVEYEVPTTGKEFTDNLYEFIDLFPKDEYIGLYHKYKNDTNIWKIVSYLNTPHFGDFIEALFSTVELKILLNFLNEHFVPFKALLVDVLDRLGIMQWWINYEFFCGHSSQKCKGTLNPNLDNLLSFVKERINLFPTKEILIPFQSKLQKNPYFQSLYLVISNIDGANIFKKITEHNVLRDFFVKFTKVGYNFRGIVRQLAQLFSWGNVLTVDLSLNQTIENFDNLIYRKELFKILDRYPDEVQVLKEFFKNFAFINSVNQFANEPQIRNVITWMENLNVPVIDYVNYYFGQDSPNTYHLRLDTQLKWKKFTADIVKFLNKNKLFEFSVAQKYNSIEFHALLEKILALNLNTLFTIYHHPEFHYLTDKLHSTGIDFMEIYRYVEDVKNDAFDLHKQ